MVCGRIITVGAGCALALVAVAQAQLYKCINSEGKVSGYASSSAECAGSYQKAPTYEPSAKKPAPAAAPPAKKAPRRLATPSPQRPPHRTALDQKRGVILLYELNSENKMLAAMDEAIVGTAPDNQKQLKVLQLQRREHALNIIALRRELKKLGINAGDSGN